MTTAKDHTRRFLAELPDEATLDDFAYQIYVRRKLEQGMEDIRAGRVATQEEVEADLRQWTAQ